MTHPDDLAETEAALARLGAGEVRDYSLEKRFRAATAPWFGAHQRHAAARFSEEDHRFLGVIEDISPRKGRGGPSAAATSSTAASSTAAAMPS
jgi:hypothetical protein